ncbi:unnamed protein product [Lymnaea stagnalis]|uniref:Uncharacterized protein n=1 Tax=Lymnaea stagnalis TaxID=6523 RepID=A0AAV2HVV9_LYMST
MAYTFVNFALTKREQRLCGKCQKLKIACTCQKKDVPKLITSSQEMQYQFLRYCYLEDMSEENVFSTDAIEVQLEYEYNCEKYDQHSEYISLNDFELSHLPDNIRHPTVCVWLRNCAPLVVKLRKYGNATGRVCILPKDLSTTRTCDDTHCRHLNELGRDHQVHGGLGIITNRHVIKTDDDAAVTRVDFFYNEETDPVMTELGCTVHLTNTKLDYSVFSCFVHSRALIEQMMFYDKRRNYAWQCIPREIRVKTKLYAIIISHPHGAAKQISIGDVVRTATKSKGTEEQENVNALRKIYNICESQNTNGLQRFEAYYKHVLKDITIPYTITWYSTATCKGSSGAPVYMGNIVNENGEEINQAHTHRGVDKGEKLNVCFT